MLRKSPLRRATPLKRKKPLRVRRVKAAKDAVFARQIKERDGWTCRLIGLHPGECRGRLQCCHIFGKGAYPHLRYDLDNAVTGCAKGHLYGTYRPLEWYEFVKWLLPRDVFKALRKRALGFDRMIADAEETESEIFFDGSPDDRTPSLESQRRDALRR